MAHRRNPHRLVLVALCAAALLHASRYLSHFSDDGFISLRYATNVVEGRGLVWNPGQWVEGYSDLLWVLGIAALEGGGADPMAAARFLGSIGLVLAVLAVAYRSVLHTGWVILSGGLCAWAVGGLETALVAGLAAWAAVLLPQERGIWLAPLLTLLRVDGLVLVLGLGLGAGRKGTRFVAAGILTALVQLGFRLWAYGDWLPNTVRAKVALTPGRLVFGLRYVGEALLIHGPLVAVAVAGALAVRQRRPELVAVTVWLAFVVVVGGDHFNGYRMFVVVVPLLALLAAEAKLHRAVVPAALLLYTGQLMTEPVLAQTRPGWALQTLELAKALKRGFGEQQPLLAVDAAGALPYGTGFEAIDMLGLNDRHIATHAAAGFGRGPLHHDRGDGAYVASLEPDLIAFCHGLGAFEPCFTSGRELVESEAFAPYHRIHVEADGVIGRYWLNTAGEHGLKRVGEGVEVPALLLSSEQRPARAGNQSFYIDLPARTWIEVELDLPAGEWHVATQGFTGPGILSSGGKVTLRARSDSDRVVRSLVWIDRS